MARDVNELFCAKVVCLLLCTTEDEGPYIFLSALLSGY